MSRRALSLLGGSLLAATVATPATAAAVSTAGAATTAKTVKSANWSGYAVHGDRYRTVSASWTEPAAHCSPDTGGSSPPRNGTASFWVGLDGYNNATVEQTGTVTACHAGQGRYYAWYEMAPAGGVTIRHPVRPGDKLSASVSYDGGGRFTLRLTDSTRGWTATETRSRASARRSSAEVIAEGPSVLLPDFGTVYFSAATVDGTSLGRLHPTRIVMVYRGKRLDRVSALHRLTRFCVTWLRG